MSACNDVNMTDIPTLTSGSLCMFGLLGGAGLRRRSGLDHIASDPGVRARFEATVMDPPLVGSAGAHPTLFDLIADKCSTRNMHTHTKSVDASDAAVSRQAQCCLSLLMAYRL